MKKPRKIDLIQYEPFIVRQFTAECKVKDKPCNVQCHSVQLDLELEDVRLYNANGDLFDQSRIVSHYTGLCMFCHKTFQANMEGDGERINITEHSPSVKAPKLKFRKPVSIPSE